MLRDVALGCAAVLLAFMPRSAAFAESCAELLARSDSLFLAYQADSALVLAHRAEGAARLARDDSTLLDALIAEGKILATIHRARQAEPVLREALKRAEDAQDSHREGHALRFLAYSLETQGQLNESREMYARLLEIGRRLASPGHEAFGRLGLAYSDLVQGRPADAVPNYERAAQLFRSTERLRDSETIALTGLGRCYAALGRTEAQRRCLQLVLERAQEAGDPYQEGHAWNNLGCLEYAVGDPARAIAHFRRSIELFERHGRSADPRGWITPTLALAHAALSLARVTEASEALENALDVCRREGFAAEEAEVLEILAQVHRAAGRPRDAIECERACLALGEAVYATTRGRTTAALARALALNGRIDEGLRLLEAELAGRNTAQPEAEVATLELAWGELLAHSEQRAAALVHLRRADEIARRFARTEERVAILVRVARCEGEGGSLARSREALEEACAIWEVGRGRSHDPEWRERLGEDARELYSAFAGQLLEESREAPPEERARLVFDRLQRFKARTLQERLRGPALFAEASQAPIPRAPVTLRELQEDVLRDGEFLLDVFRGDEAVILIAADRRDCRVRVLSEKDGDTLARFQRWMSLVTSEVAPSRGARDVAGTGAEASLGAVLFEGFEGIVHRNRRVLFSPDGEWHRLPLGALAVPDSAGRPTLLASTHEIVRIPSATLLAELRARGASLPDRERSEPGALLAVAGSDALGRPSLPGAAREVRSLARRYAGVAAYAREPAPGRDDLCRARILHFASHAEVDDERPWRSALLLSPDRLEAAQIADLSLDADLAVLSACESAGGRILSGEGVLGISAGFISAGVPSVVATLWPVRDRVAARFVESFYLGLERGETAASALREAQAVLRGDPRTRLPIDWAGFVLLGEGDTRVHLVRREAARWRVGVLAGGALLVAASVWGWESTRRRRSDRRDFPVTKRSPGSLTS